jgi:chromosome segregation ATPase
MRVADMRNVTWRQAGLALVALVAPLLLLAPAVAADKDGKDGKDQLRALQQRLRAAEADKGRLSQERAALDEQVKDAQSRVVQSQRQTAAAVHRQAQTDKALQAATAEKAALEAQVAAAEAKLSALAASLSERTAQLQQVNTVWGQSEAARRQTEATLAQRSTALAECSDKNDKLYRLGNLLLSGDAAALPASPTGREPVTQLARVAVENKLEEMREQLDAQQYGPVRLARREAALRQAAAAAAEAAVPPPASAAAAGNAERARLAQTRRAQQSELDSWARMLRNFTEGFEW